MSRGYVITGTDTGIGKTVVAAMLTQALGARYWKPVQAGQDDGTDRDQVAELAGVARESLLPEGYRLTSPLSPHRAAEIDGVEIDPASLKLPEVDGTLIVEGAGGVLVPVTRKLLFADLFASWQLPVILCARTTLGTINHTLLSLEALRSRGCDVHGIIFVGDEMPDSERTICEMGRARHLGRLPWLDELNTKILQGAFRQHFNRADFAPD